MDRVCIILYASLLICGLACSETAAIEFRYVASTDDECASCEAIEYVASAGQVKTLLASKQADLVLTAQDVKRATTWQSAENSGTWNVLLNLHEAAQEEWLTLVTDAGDGRVVALLGNTAISVLEGSELRFLVLSGFKNIGDVEKFLAVTNLNGKEIRGTEAEMEKARAKSRSQNPELEDRIRNADEYLRRAEIEDGQWNRLDSLLEEEPQDLEAILDEAESIRREGPKLP